MQSSQVDPWAVAAPPVEGADDSGALSRLSESLRTLFNLDGDVAESVMPAKPFQDRARPSEIVGDTRDPAYEPFTKPFHDRLPQENSVYGNPMLGNSDRDLQYGEGTDEAEDLTQKAYNKANNTPNQLHLTAGVGNSPFKTGRAKLPEPTYGPETPEGGDDYQRGLGTKGTIFNPANGDGQEQLQTEMDRADPDARPERGIYERNRPSGFSVFGRDSTPSSGRGGRSSATRQRPPGLRPGSLDWQQLYDRAA